MITSRFMLWFCFLKSTDAHVAARIDRRTLHAVGVVTHFDLANGADANDAAVTAEVLDVRQHVVDRLRKRGAGFDLVGNGECRARADEVLADARARYCDITVGPRCRPR